MESTWRESHHDSRLNESCQRQKRGLLELTAASNIKATATGEEDGLAFQLKQFAGGGAGTGEVCLISFYSSFSFSLGLVILFFFLSFSLGRAMSALPTLCLRLLQTIRCFVFL